MRQLPVIGPGACFTDTQGREPGGGTTPDALVDLVSSISFYGVLQPGLVEESPDGTLLLVAGERRLRACRWGAVNQPDNPHFQTFPAWVCPGPLSEEERRAWQLIENLAREDLQPGELAAALLYERCAMLTSRLLAAGIPIPADVATIEDPARRWRALERLRGSVTDVAAPWTQVLRRLGLQLSERKARALVRAFAEMPPELAWDMDAHRVALTTRLDWLRLDTGRSAAAAGIWAAVKARGAPQLLSGAVRASLERPDLDVDEAVDRAAEARDSANEARSLRLRPTEPSAGDTTTPVDPAVVDATLGSLRGLLEQLRAGSVLERYQTGSLRLLTVELAGLLEPA
jgi:ParB family chromosome partitioning protein